MRSSRSWRRIGAQLGILAGFGLALVQGIEPSRAAPHCIEEGQCTFTKPLLLIAVDYSTAMNAMFDADKTRWEAAVAAVEAIVDSNNGYLPGSTLLALMRFGHDPEPDQPGTTIVGDASGLVDGQRLDVGWYDPLTPDKDYFHCNGEAIKAALQATPPPLGGAPTGIGAWTAGALTRASALVAEAVAEHPADPKGPRKVGLILITQGMWSDAAGTQVLQPPADDPTPVVADMWQNAAIPTFVLSLGDAQGTATANELAVAGGTGQAMVEASSLTDALAYAVQDIINQIEPPVCEPAKPRLMFILDGSSSMLNVMNDSVHGAMGETRWDLLRTAGIEEALRKTTPPLVGGFSEIGDWSLVAVSVFGDDAPAEQKLLVDYGPCHYELLAWALDPVTSCSAPGCVDPWGGPPITWTFKTSEQKPFPAPATTVTSHMPRCDVDPQKPGACAGSGAFVHLGLELAQGHVAEYRAACLQPDALEPCLPETRFRNVLIMDGTYDSDDAAVEAPLTQMFDDGVITYVIGLGELAGEPAAVEQLTMMAAWGSGGQLDFFPAATQVELQAALATIFEHVFTGFEVDPCCGTLFCGMLDEGEGWEPDPMPPLTGSGSGSEGSSGGGVDEPTTGGEAGTTGTTGTAGTTGTTGEPTTGGEAPTSGGVPPATSAGPTSGEPPEGTDSDGAPGSQDDGTNVGCGCVSAGAQGLASTLASFGLVALGRRRRKSEHRDML